jgi:uncharacterized cupredoxin-like copper-binding protein
MHSTGSVPIVRVLAAILLLGAIAGVGSRTVGHAHEHHAAFSAGEPGNPKQPARVIKIAMQENGKNMMFDPAVITIRRGEQIRFVLFNEGTESHEFILATVAENQKHAALMKKFPEMEHDDPNAKRVAVFDRGELLWKFTTAGEFEFACLIPGHYDAGMHGKVIVK